MAGIGALLTPFGHRLFTWLQCNSSVWPWLAGLKLPASSIHPLLCGLIARRCPMPSAPLFSTFRDLAPFCWVCEFPFHPTPWRDPTILDTVFLFSILLPSLQTSPPSLACCPSSCICVQTSLVSFPWSGVWCSSCITLFCTLLHSWSFVPILFSIFFCSTSFQKLAICLCLFSLGSMFHSHTLPSR